MKLNTSNKNKLKLKMFDLMDEVQLILKQGVSIDDFLDESDLFSAWEEIIPEKEYTLFIMAVLNNIMKDLKDQGLIKKNIKRSDNLLNLSS